MAGEPSGASGKGRGRPDHGARWRVVAGAALVTAAAALVLVAHRSAQQPPSDRWLVVSADVPSGTPLERDHLAAAAIELPDGVDAVSVDDLDEVLGHLSAHPLGAGRLVVRSDLLDGYRFDAGSGIEVAVTLDPRRAPLDALAPGDRVDVLATDPEGEGTRSLVSRARVVALDDGERDGIGTTGGARVRLAVSDLDSATAIVDAAVREQLTVVVPAPLPDAAPDRPTGTTGEGGRR